MNLIGRFNVTSGAHLESTWKQNRVYEVLNCNNKHTQETAKSLDLPQSVSYQVIFIKPNFRNKTVFSCKISTSYF